MLDYLMQLDRNLFLFLNGLHTSWLDPIMFMISDRFVWIPLYFLILYLSIKRFGWKAVYFMIFVVILITLADQLTNVMKAYFLRYRPSRDPSLEGLVHLVNNSRGGGKYGFVSAHAANTFALAVFVSQILKKNAKYLMPVMMTYAVLNTYSRIYLGVHYPGDVIAGGLTGIAVGMLMIVIWKYFSQRYVPETS